MGYTHYWRRPLEIERRVFKLITEDFVKLLPAFEKAGVRLAGPMGTGKPKITHKVVAFNGARNCGHPADYELVIPWPAPGAGGVFADSNPICGEWHAGHMLITRACPGDCSYESFVFKRIYKPCPWQKPDAKGQWFSFCKTAFRPYDLAVTAFLIVAKHHLGDAICVSTDGEDCHWFDAKLLCQSELGYGFGYAITPEGTLEREEVLLDDVAG